MNTLYYTDVYVFLWFKYMVRYTYWHIVLFSDQAIIGEPASIEIAPCMTLVQECNASASHLQLLLRH